MLSEFKLLKSIFRVRSARTDSAVFRLHYSFTVAALAAATLLVSGIHWVGNAIHCAFNKQHFTQDYVESMCWVNGTYYHPDGGRAGRYRYLEAAPHIRPGRAGHGGQEDARFVMYYQWVAFCLFFQALLFYFPRWAWKEIEGGTLERLLEGKTSVATYLCQNSRKNNRYMACYLLAEVASLGNLVGQMFLLDRFFNGLFWDYGVNVMRFAYDNYQGTNPMLVVFPRMTKCSAKAFAFNGNLDTIEALCILPLNVLNEKIYLFQWFWFLVLFALTVLLMAYRIVIVISPGFRLSLLSQRLGYMDRKLVERIFKKISPGDWFVMYTMAPHMEFAAMSEILREMDRRMLFPGSDDSTLGGGYVTDDRSVGSSGNGTVGKRHAPPVPPKKFLPPVHDGNDTIRLRPMSVKVFDETKA